MLRTISLTVMLLLALPGPVAANDAAAARLAEAVRFRTISFQDLSLVDYNEFARFHAFLRDSFPRVFAALDVETVNQHSLLLYWRGSNSTLEPILFTAHMDVVPIEPGTEQDWPHPPFAGTVVEGRIHGRGTLDDKQGLMGLLEAVELLLKDGYQPQRSVVFAFGHDEEIGGREGARKLAERMRERGWHFAWMVDEGGMLVANNPLLPERNIAMINIAAACLPRLRVSSRIPFRSACPGPLWRCLKAWRRICRSQSGSFSETCGSLAGWLPGG